MNDRYAREEEIREAFEHAHVGQVLTVCRWNCKTTEGCPMCARIRIVDGMCVEDVLKLARPNRA